MKNTITTVLMVAALVVVVVAGVDAFKVEDAGSGRSSAYLAPEASSRYTIAQNNAIDSAVSYLKAYGMSRAGLMGQLSTKAGEGFTRKDAVFAVRHIKVNWNVEAVQSAQSYLETNWMSRAGLIRQLSSRAGERFTHAQAVYAANEVGL
jgi:Host cell surface-exposed lipoprotein